MSDWIAKLGFDSPPEQDSSSVEAGQFATAEVIDAAKASLDFLAALAMPAVFKYLFPPVFKSIWEWLTSYVHRTRDFSQLAIGLPRGFGKTIVIKLFVLYTILFTKKTFILIIAGTQSKANNIVSDIFNMLTEPNILKVFGDWRAGVVTDRQDLKEFGFRGRSIIVMGAGCGSDIRGITLLNARPDIMIFDDIQTREDADSETVSRNLETWMVGTAMKAKSPEGCLFIFIANMYPTKHSILRKLKQNPTWIKFICGAITSTGESIWEDLQPIKQLIQEFRNDEAMGRAEIFYAEVLNDENASVNNLVDYSKLASWADWKDELPTGSFIIIDPSNDKVNSDAVAIGLFDIRNGVPCCRKIINERLSPSQTIERALQLAISTQTRLIAVESNAYQYSLLHWFGVITRQLGIVGIECVDIYSGQLSKNSRILTMFKALQSKDIVLDDEVRPLVMSEISGYSPLRRDNVDNILDLLTYSSKVMELYGMFILSLFTLEAQDHEALEISNDLITCEF